MILLAALAAAALQPPADPRPAHADACIAEAHRDPEAARVTATRWQAEGGGAYAAECIGVADVQDARWTPAALAFEQAARAAGPGAAAGYWTQAGNAWLAGGSADKAVAALDSAIGAGTLDGLALGEARLDRARAEVAANRPEAARADIDAALSLAAGDPMAWLLSATLARRTGDLPRAAKDIAVAERLAGDDPAVPLEAGNIAAARGDAAGARTAWRAVQRLAPESSAAASAAAALAQFGDAPPEGAQSPVGR